MSVLKMRNRSPFGHGANRFGCQMCLPVAVYLESVSCINTLMEHGINNAAISGFQRDKMVLTHNTTTSFFSLAISSSKKSFSPCFKRAFTS